MGRYWTGDIGQDDIAHPGAILDWAIIAGIVIPFKRVEVLITGN